MISNIVNTSHLARKTDPVTSHLAAARVREFTESHRQMILRCLDDHGPCTVDEIAALTGMESQAVNKRLPELQRFGVAYPVEGLLRPSDSGRMARVWGVV
jgi:predicted ArsR family transcriptional regulator